MNPDQRIDELTGFLAGDLRPPEELVLDEPTFRQLVVNHFSPSCDARALLHWLAEVERDDCLLALVEAGEDVLVRAIEATAPPRPWTGELIVPLALLASGPDDVVVQHLLAESPRWEIDMPDILAATVRWCGAGTPTNRAGRVTDFGAALRRTSRHEMYQCQRCRDYARQRIRAITPTNLLDLTTRYEAPVVSVVAAAERASEGHGRELVADPDVAAAVLSGLRARDDWGPVSGAMSGAGANALWMVPVAMLEQDGSDVALQMGSELHHSALPRTVHGFAEKCKVETADLEGSRTVSLALAWAAIRDLASYGWGQQDEVRGVEALLFESLDDGDLWNTLAPVVIQHADADAIDRGRSLDLVALAAARHDAVRVKLEGLGERGDSMGDRARGLLAHVHGVVSSAAEMDSWWADVMARRADGSPLQLAALKPVSAIWLGSPDLEQILDARIRQAADAFRPVVAAQGGTEEEQLTSALLSELGFAFRNAELIMRSAGPASPHPIRVSQRRIKKSEEKVWGCDVALSLVVDIPDHFKIRTVLPIQVKKSLQITKPTKDVRERWQIELGQLHDVLALSDGACYWLILSTGEVACVRALYLAGLQAGQSSPSAKSFTLSYRDVRHAAVPLQQHIGELFLGTWLGSWNSPLEALVAEIGNVVPMHLFEIEIRSATDDLANR